MRWQVSSGQRLTCRIRRRWKYFKSCSYCNLTQQRGRESLQIVEYSSDGLTCTYVKDTPQYPSTDSIAVPGAVKDLRSDIGFASVNGRCERRLNITWTLSYDGSLNYLSGFYLNISLVKGGRKAVIHQMFNVSSTNWSTAYNTQFRHECMNAQPGTLYHIELYSLPMNSQRHHAITESRTQTDFPSRDRCDRTDDSTNTFNWTATIWTSPNPSNASIEVCFYTAPPSFNFRQYSVSLLPNRKDPMNLVIQKKIISLADPNSKDVRVCHTFFNICSGVYKIWVMPVNSPYGTCRSGIEYMGSCTATVVESINMTQSVCSSTPATLRTISDGQLDNTRGFKMPGIVIGVVLTAILAAVLLFAIYIYRYRPLTRRFYRDIKFFRNSNSAADSCRYPIDDQQIVLLIYSSDNEFHQKVVRNFAAFLQSCCKCDVRFDDWSQVDISQTNALDWLTKQLHQAKHIIFINSLGAFMQHKAWIEGATCLPVKELLLPDMFIPALRQIQARVYEKPPTKRLQYYHVYFPYTDVKHLLDVSFGQRYKLMTHIEDLFLNIHGMTKYSGAGLTSACQINAHGYTGSVEGQALQSAIEEASASFKRNPNWFPKCYTYRAVTMDMEVSLVNNRTVHRTTDCQPLTVVTTCIGGESSPNASFDSADSKVTTTKSSDEGVHFDQEIVPPSSSGSCSSDMEHRSGISFDVGYGDTIDVSTFYTNSPSINLGFCPPVPDDDDDGTASSIGSRILFEKLNAWNDQFDRGGSPFSSWS